MAEIIVGNEGEGGDKYKQNNYFPASRLILIY